MRIIEQTLWQDIKFRKEITDIRERYFWLYLLTCQHSKSCGIFHLPLDIASLETHLSESDILRYINHLQSLKLLRFNETTEEMIIYNLPRYNIIRLGKPMEDCLRKELSLVKDTNLIHEMIDYLIKYTNQRTNDRRYNILINIINIYKNIINTTTTTNNDSCHDSWDEEEIRRQLRESERN